MITIPNRVSPGYERSTIGSLNQKVTPPITGSSVGSLNTNTTNGGPSTSASVVQQTPQPMPQTQETVQPASVQGPGKVSADGLKHVRVLINWEVNNPRCDVDLSAFILGNDGRVLGDEWFVFYGQTASPDGNVRLSVNAPQSAQQFDIDLDKLNTNADKIIFVLTINEALNGQLNFSMLNFVDVKMINSDTNQEIASLHGTSFNSYAVSLVVGDIAYRNGNWNCRGLTNGVSRDLAGLCESYGVNLV